MKQLFLATILLILSGGASAADVTLAWDYAPTTPPNHDGFRLYYRYYSDPAFTVINDAIPPNDRTRLHTGVVDGTLLYKLVAYNASGESAPAYLWAVIGGEPIGPPPGPSAITITVTVQQGL